ncbi:uncharacterized protein Dana_GF26548 [Drosophila ananassae]|uniref:Uncharacterized protein n=1 Tax=Drosophila ananassae TaxID=7217 RepID=A0A0P9A3Z5_DROAN|nr:ras-related protein Rab-5A [Drosophila ananassae]KPU73310.1 uncharacterized protein Dana_GF26548 [Drosophila ananassae]
MEPLTGEAVYNLIILGNREVGKTSISWRYVKEVFYKNPLPTEGVDFLTKTIPEPNLRVRLKISDTSGKECFREILLKSTRVHGAMLVYDIHDRESYDAAKQWVVKLKARQYPWIVLALVGNKMDVPKDRVISTEEAKHYAQENGLLFSETSAKADINITECFLNIAIRIRQMDVTAILEECDQRMKNRNQSCRFPRFRWL